MEKCSALLKGLLYLLSSWSLLPIDIAVPKKQRAWLIASHQGLTGNARFFAEYVLETYKDIVVYFCAYDDSLNLKLTEDRFREKYGERFYLFKKRNFAALTVSLKAGSIFVSHDLSRDVGFPLTTLGGRRTVINLWHGIAVKKHWLAKKYNVYTSHRQKARQFSKIIASSAADAVAKAAVFHKNLDDIWITGNPRNDILAGSNYKMPEDLKNYEESLQGELGGRTLILYAPTWRSYNETFSLFDRYCMERLSRVLNEYNAVLGLRLHAKDEHKFGGLYKSWSQIINLGPQRFPETQLVLKKTRLLVTDYSSIWIDYLLTGNPVIAYWYDLDEYSGQRGTLWDFSEMFPGEKTYSGPDLVSAIEKALASGLRINEEHEHKYKFVRVLFHRHADGANSERLAKEMSGKK